jgi:hypothetical protein
MDARSKIHHIDEACCFAARDDVTLSIWRAEASPSRVIAQRAVLERTLRLYDRVYSLTAFRAADMSMGQFTDAKLRVEFEKLGKMMDGPLAAHALVIIGTGFIAATVRSASVSMAMVMKQRVNNKVFDDLYTAARWLPTARPEGAKPGEVDAVEALARAMSAELDVRAAASKPTQSVAR